MEILERAQIPDSKAKEMLALLNLLEGFLIGARVPQEVKRVREQIQYLERKLNPT